MHERLDIARIIAVLCRVAQEILALVGSAADETVMEVCVVVKDGHPYACHDIAKEIVGILKALNL